MRACSTVFIYSLCAVWAVSQPAWTNDASVQPNAEVSFEKDVRPILKAHCFECHGEGEELKGGIDLRLRRLILKGGESGAGFMPGDPSKSTLYEQVAEEYMPPGDTKLTQQEKDTIKSWITKGAKTVRPEPEQLDPGIYFTPEELKFWSFQPIKKHAVPTVKENARVRTPVDSFLLKKMESVGMTFSPDTDRYSLVRRLYFDLIGLPPSPKEVDSFVNDQSPDAYEKLVDRLLSSPKYGERWGRHWLDVVGYADSEGFTIADPERKAAYKYRDYVIRAFNNDKPFDQFIREQLAGDEMLTPPFNNLTSEQAEKLIATGYLRMAADGTASGGVDRAEASNQVMADTIQIVGSSLLGLTLNCSQCHNHRYDPIPQTDYYHLRAIFEPAYNCKKWKTPRQRLISLYTDADRSQAAEIEKQAKVIDKEYQALSDKLIAETLEDQLQQHVPPEFHKALRAAYRTAIKKRTAEQKALLKKYPKILKISRGSLYLYDREINLKRAALKRELPVKTKKYLAVATEANILKIPAEKQAVARAALKVASAKRTEEQQVLLKEYGPLSVTEKNLAQHNAEAAKELQSIRNQIAKLKPRDPQLKSVAAKAAKLRSTKPKEEFVRALNETPGTVPQTFFFSRGDYKSPKQQVEPSILSILSKKNAFDIPVNNPNIPTTGRRLAFAKYLTSGKHPLVARVLVNRFWMHHFGKGIVSTTGDFGQLGERPSHPQLLDWLAAWFMEEGWSLKKFHRLIITSTAYRQGLRKIPLGKDVDPDNRLLSGMSLRRLEAEVLRDSILSISAQLNEQQFGPPVPVMHDRTGQIIVGKENLNAGRPGAKLDLKGAELRRSIYIQVRRTRPLAMLDMFDAPRMSPNCESRPSSTVAPQSLMLMNNDFVVEQSTQFARRVIQETGTDVNKQVAKAWQYTFSRPASEEELKQATTFVIEQLDLLKHQSEAQKMAKGKSGQSLELQALASFCQTLIGSNQFLYVD